MKPTKKTTTEKAAKTHPWRKTQSPISRTEYEHLVAHSRVQASKLADLDLAHRREKERADGLEAEIRKLRAQIVAPEKPATPKADTAAWISPDRNMRSRGDQ